MTNIHLPRSDFGDRIASMRNLQYASKDINDWEFTVCRKPWGSPPSMDHVYVGRDKTTGIEAEWPVDQTHAIDGQFDPEHKRIRSEFAESLQQLAYVINMARAKQAGLVLPKRNTIRQTTARLLACGDHLNRNRGY